MIPALKSCYVLLNKNLPELGETIGKINYFPKVGMENCEDLSYRRKTSYSDNMKNTEGKASDTDFSSDSSSSDDVETPQRQKRKMKHNTSSTGPKKLSCFLCNETFNSNLSYLSHKRSHESRPYKCILCGKGCKNRQSYIQHMKNLHPEVDPFICEYRGCEQNFKTQKGLEIHRKIHWRYMCKYCKKLFARKHWMKKHVMQVH